MSEQIYKPKAISGFPEWLPEYRTVELRWLDHIRATFERYGFTSIETPCAEELDVLLAKGETDKEIYTLTRLQAGEDDKGSRLGLHFDQTVPMARYVAQHFNELDFPFKRYQTQKVWRGERPQLGRSREFLQCDIDVINVDNLPLHFDAEMPAVIFEALSGLPEIGRFQIRFSNRKILLGLLEHLGVTDSIPVTRAVDKLEKIGAEAVTKILQDEGLNDTQIKAVLDLVTTDDLNKIVPQGAQMEEGLTELRFVLAQLSHLPAHAYKADLTIVRGLDYYTGTVYETRLLDIPEFTSSICSGGRYDDLAGSFINKHLPGVGISIGFTRLFEVLLHYGYIKPGRKCPTEVLVSLPAEEQRKEAMALAHTLRQRGIAVEVYHSDQKFKKQLQYAEKKGIPYIWFLPNADQPEHSVKDMATGAQSMVNPDQWMPNREEKNDNRQTDRGLHAAE
jgi:histidyl-tRNA synthetase